MVVIAELRFDRIIPGLDAFRAISTAVTGTPQEPKEGAARPTIRFLHQIDQPEIGVRVRVTDERTWWIAAQSASQHDSVRLIEEHLKKPRDQLFGGARVERLGIRSHWIEPLVAENIESAARAFGRAFLHPNTTIVDRPEFYDCGIIHNFRLPGSDGKVSGQIQLGPMGTEQLNGFLLFPDRAADVPPFVLFVDVDYGIAQFGSPNVSQVRGAMNEALGYALRTADDLSAMMSSGGTP